MLYMTLPKYKGYYFEVNMDDSYQYKKDVDEWGAAVIFDGNGNGVEYNYCYDGRNEASAIYKFEGIDTDYSVYQSYEIDFSNDNWQEKLLDAMIDSYHEFFDEE